MRHCWDYRYRSFWASINDTFCGHDVGMRLSPWTSLAVITLRGSDVCRRFWRRRTCEIMWNAGRLRYYCRVASV
ncbi:hypothetical protein KCP78_00440 [Salmonella enterica subsp. enterica]|nr:hypothetical protein KCP78_00440 [Salmonella enterica subsp. enterica]